MAVVARLSRSDCPVIGILWLLFRYSLAWLSFHGSSGVTPVIKIGCAVTDAFLLSCHDCSFCVISYRDCLVTAVYSARSYHGCPEESRLSSHGCKGCHAIVFFHISFARVILFWLS
jgi:hypothetical protein